MKRSSVRQWIQPVWVLIPLISSIVSCYIRSIVALAAVIISLFFLVACLPVCKKRENLWMFVFSGVSLLPVNIVASRFALNWLGDDLFANSGLLRGTVFLMVIHVLFCMEEIFLGLLTRLIWRRQYKVVLE